MPSRVPTHRVLDICDPRRSWPWGCPAPSDEALRHLLDHAPLVASPIEGNATAEQHIGRVRYLAKHGWGRPIEIDVGVPCLGYSGPSWPVTDGNHRLWAATIRRDCLVEVDIAGQVDHAAQLLGVPESEIVRGRVEQTAQESRRMSKKPEISLRERIADADARGSNWLARANELAEAGKKEQAQRCYDKGQFWLDRSNKLRGLN